jgi:xanthosine utilization system XapX-like protein
VFLHWLFTVFPQEMRQGWAYLRPDLVLWFGLSALFAVAMMALPAPGEETTPALPYAIAAASALVNMMLPAILFTAQIESRQLTWGPVLALMVRKAPPLIVYSLVAFLLAFGAHSAMVIGLSFALCDTTLLIPLTTIAGLVILLSIIVRYSFLPFLVVLTDREQIPAALWQWQRLPQLAPLFWPLTASARMTEGHRWTLVFFTMLAPAIRAGALLMPAPLVLPASMVALMLATAVQGVFFHHYRSRCEETGVPQPTLPFEDPVAA